MICSMNKPYKGLNPAHRERIKAFEKAVREHEMMGAKHPDDHAEIEEELEYRRTQLVETVLKLYGKQQK